MTRGEAVNWIINISADIGKAEHRELWHYEQALSEIREMLESEPERKKGKWELCEEKAEESFWVGSRCSECNYWKPMGQWNYCPNCGSYNGGET